MAFHFLDKDMMRNIITSIIRPKLEYAEVIWSPSQENASVQIGKNTENCK